MPTLQDHLNETTPCNSLFDGYDKGTLWADCAGTREIVIGRMTNELRQRVEIVAIETNGDHDSYEVRINGRTVFQQDCPRAKAIRVARWWMDGCPA